MDKKRKFVTAMKARGGLKYYDLGGGVDLSNGVQAGGAGGAPISQGGFIGAMTPQSAYAAQLAPTTQMNYAPAVNTGYNVGAANLGAMNTLAGNLGNIAAGQGPNPAQTQFQQNMGNVEAQQAAQAAGQRGAAGNVGLMERNVAQAGAGTQQQAAGTALAAQQAQQLGALSAQGQVLNNVAGASGQMLNTGAGATNTQNANMVSNYGTTQGINAATTMGNTQTLSTMAGNLAGGGGSGMGSMMAMMAEGGTVPQPSASPSSTPTKLSDDPWNAPPVSAEESQKFAKGANFADGGGVGTSAPMGAGPASFVGQYLNGQAALKTGSSSGGGSSKPNPTANSEPNADMGQESSGYQNLQSSGQIGQGPTAPGSSSGIGSFTSGQQGAAGPAFAKGGKMTKTPVTTPEMASKGQAVPGKAKVKGDNLKNDTVPAMLSPDEIVLPRTVTQAPDAPQRAAQFVQHVKAKSGMKRKGKK